MSLFGAATGVVDEITLPDVNNVDKREMLNWERELIGLYISDHPLTPYQQTFARIVSYFSGQLAEAQHEGTVLLSENIVKENLQIVLVLLGEMILTATRIDN